MKSEELSETILKRFSRNVYFFEKISKDRKFRVMKKCLKTLYDYEKK